MADQALVRTVIQRARHGAGPGKDAPMTTVLLLIAVSLAIELLYRLRRRTLRPLPATVVNRRRHRVESSSSR